MIRELANDFRVIIPDLKGHGTSAAPPTGWAPAELGADLISVLDAYAVERVVIIGHSLGADAATRAALLQPNRVSGLVLEDPPWVPEWERYDETQRTGLAQLWFHKLKGLAELSNDDLEIVARDHAPGWSDEDLSSWISSKREVRLNVVRSFLATRDPWQSIVLNLNCPTLLITGDPSLGSIVTQKLTKEAVEINPKVRAVQIPNAGHSIRRDNFESYKSHVVAFLSEVAQI
jgi:pimeloyl-ACP methyl ester carboxylesterase